MADTDRVRVYNLQYLCQYFKPVSRVVENTQGSTAFSLNLLISSEKCSPLSVSAESIPTLKNRESIHFDFLLRGFVEKESIHDSWIDSLLYNDSWC